MSDERKEPEYVSLEDIPDTETGNDPDVDPFAVPPPPGDGVFVVRVQFLDVTKPFELKKGDDYEYIKIPLKLKVEEPGVNEGRVAFDRMVNTKPMQGGGSRVSGVIRALGERPERTHKAQAAQLQRLLGPQGALLRVKGQRRWEQRVQNGSEWDTKFSLRGEKNAPQLADGSYNHVVKSSYDNSDVAAQWFVESYLPLQES